MKATELRIGNLVYYNGILTKITPTEITFQEYWQRNKGKNSLKPEESIQPIPLTEEILFRCGFEWCAEAFGYFDKLHAAYIWDNGDIEIHPFCTNDQDCWVKIKYVHQLQNLYFALTGEELNIEL
jgi:hypothetical protein